MGYEAIDNLPMSLIERLLDGAPLDHPLVLGIDVRNRLTQTSAGTFGLRRIQRRYAGQYDWNSAPSLSPGRDSTIERNRSW